MIRILALWLILAACAQAAQRYVRTDGSNANSGATNTSGGAWLTIAYAITQAQPGDIVTVQAGTYPETLTTTRAGTLGNPITFETSGTVYVYRWTLNHAYQTIRGFNIRYAMSTSDLDAYVRFGDGGDNCIVENCRFGPGAAIKATDLVFADTNPDTITSATGGFLAAGFRDGGVARAFNSTTTTDLSAGNRTEFDIATVTDTVLTLSGAESVVAESGKTGFLFGIRNAVAFSTTADNNIVRNNLFQDTASRWVLMQGTGNLLENNVFVNMDGFDGVLYGGTNTTIRRNVIRDGTSYRYFNPSPDMLGIISPNTTTTNILIEENMLLNLMGAAGFDHGNPTPGPFVWRKNVFWNVVYGYKLRSDGVEFDRNTFYNVAQTSSILAEAADHAILFLDDTGNPPTATITSNIFIGCGAGAGATKGWYIDTEPSLTLTADYNYVAGASPTFGIKTGFSETNGINGGDPMFVDPSDPLGPDGLQFTADDGLRLAAGSPAIGQGPGGADLGAYDYSTEEPPPDPGPATGTINATTTTTTTVNVQ